MGRIEPRNRYDDRAQRPPPRSPVLGDLFRFTIEAPAMGQEARPGQFVMVKVSDGAFPCSGVRWASTTRMQAASSSFSRSPDKGPGSCRRRKAATGSTSSVPSARASRSQPPRRGKGLCRRRRPGHRPALFPGPRAGQGRDPAVRPLRRTMPRRYPLRDRFEKEGIELLCSTDDGCFGFAGLRHGARGH